MTKDKVKKGRNMMRAILSLSLLTVMAGAAVAPALEVISRYFRDVNPLFVQMIISIPALFIVISNLFFPILCRKFRSRNILMAGLILYTVGGCAAGMFSNIFAVLAARALVGVGVGIVMPMSTGLLAFYYTKDKQDKLMGWSSAMNQMGGVIATLLSGILANISWRASFLVYLMGMISIILCLLYLPNDRIASRESKEKSSPDIKVNGTGKYVIAMFMLMLTFFVYPSSFAMETVAEGIIPAKYIAVIMASMDFAAFIGGLLFVHLKKGMGEAVKFMAPALFLCGYLLLQFAGGWAATLIGSWLIGFANGEGIPYIIATASKKAGRLAASTVMPKISAALYLAQFLTPVILSAVTAVAGTEIPYMTAIVTSVIFLICSFRLND